MRYAAIVVTRQQQIVDVAAELFAERGFHGVSVQDIGEAVGISGPALYKHFSGKAELLQHSLTSVSDRLLAEGTRRAEEAPDASAALDALIDWHVDFALTHPALIVIQEREWSTLDAASRERVRETQLAYIDVWVGVLRELRTDLDRPAARASVQAAFGLLNSTPHSARLNDRQMRALLTQMAHRALLAP